MHEHVHDRYDLSSTCAYAPCVLLACMHATVSRRVSYPGTLFNFFECFVVGSLRGDESTWPQTFGRWFLKFMSKRSRRFLELKMNIFICLRSDKSTNFHHRNWLIFWVKLKEAWCGVKKNEKKMKKERKKFGTLIPVVLRLPAVHSLHCPAFRYLYVQQHNIRSYLCTCTQHTWPWDLGVVNMTLRIWASCTCTSCSCRDVSHSHHRVPPVHLKLKGVSHYNFKIL